VTKDVAETLSAFFTSVLTSKVCPKASQIPDPSVQICGSGALPRIEENQVRGILQKIINLLHGSRENASNSCLEGLL